MEISVNKIIITMCLIFSSKSFSEDSACLELSNKILAKNNLGTYYKPSNTKVDQVISSRKYKQERHEGIVSAEKAREDRIFSLVKDEMNHLESVLKEDPQNIVKHEEAVKNLQKKIKSIQYSHDDDERNWKNKQPNDGPMQKKIEYESESVRDLINQYNKDFTIMTSFKDKKRRVDFLYDVDELVAVLVSNVDESGKQKLKIEELYEVNDCRISKARVAELYISEKNPDETAGGKYKYLSYSLCQNLKKIEKVALKIEENVDDHKYNCKAQLGRDDGHGCFCHDKTLINPWFETCTKNKKRIEVVKPEWKVFEDFVRDHDSLWGSVREYKRSTYRDIEKNCARLSDVLQEQVAENIKSSQESTSTVAPQ